MNCKLSLLALFCLISASCSEPDKPVPEKATGPPQQQQDASAQSEHSAQPEHSAHPEHTPISSQQQQQLETGGEPVPESEPEPKSVANAEPKTFEPKHLVEAKPGVAAPPSGQRQQTNDATISSSSSLSFCLLSTFLAKFVFGQC